MTVTKLDSSASAQSADSTQGKKDSDVDTLTAVSRESDIPTLSAADSGASTLGGTDTWNQSSTGDDADFETIDVLGRGGMGEVLLARQRYLEREVAVKVMREQRRQQADRQRWFQDEARIGGRLEHPNVVPVHDGGDDYFVMRRVRGETFSDVLADPNRGIADHVDIIRRSCDALAYAHDRGIIHRDVKPANIMVGGFGEVLVMDWGLAVQLDQVETEDGGLVWRCPSLHSDFACSGTPRIWLQKWPVVIGRVFPRRPMSFLVGGLLYRVCDRTRALSWRQCFGNPGIGPAVPL